MALFGRSKLEMIDPADALPGRDTPIPLAPANLLTGNPMNPPFPDGIDTIVVGMGCFWGAERKFWEADGIYTTAVGYAAGFTPNATYEEVCSGRTGHNEVVLAAFDTSLTSFERMLAVFWDNHNPTQGMRQGNDMGTQYRSGIYYRNDEQRALAEASRTMFQGELDAAGFGPITTEIVEAGPFYYAEDYHQQYLHKNPMGYCGLGGTGVSCPIGLNVEPVE